MGYSLLFWLDLNAFLVASVVAFALSISVLSLGPRHLANHLFAGATFVGGCLFFLSAVERMLLHLEGANVDAWFETQTLMIGITATLAFLYAAYYRGRATLWVRILFFVGLGINVLAAFPLFAGQLVTNVHLGPSGLLTYRMTDLGYTLGLVPLSYYIGAMAFLWQGRQERDPFMIWAALFVVAGICFAGLLKPSAPFVSLSSLASLLLIAYGVISRQILNPLRDLALGLENKVVERTRSLSETAARLEQANRDLLHQTEEQNALLAALPDLVFRLSGEGIFLDCKVSHSERLLLPVDKFLGRSLEEILPPHVAVVTHDAIRKALQTHEVVACEYQIHPNSPYRFYEARASSCGENQAMVLVRDITARKQAEIALQESEASYRSLFDSVQEAIYVQDSQGRFLDVNQGAEKMYGYPRQYFLGQTAEIISAPGKNDLQALTPKFQRALAGEPQSFEFWGQRSNGDLFPKEVRLYKGMYHGQEVVFTLATDITQRKLAEETLHASEQRLKGILETVPDAIVIVDASGQITYANPFAERLLGLTSAEIATKAYNAPEWKITAPDGGPFPESALPFALVMKQGQPVYGVEHAIEGVGGQRTILSINAAPLRDANGQFMGMLAAMVDVTKRKEVERALQRHAGEMMVLYSTLLAINSQPDLHSLLYTVVEHASGLLGAEGGALYLAHPDEGYIELVISYYLPADYTGYRLKYGEGVAGRVAQTGQMLGIPDYRLWEPKAENFANLDVRRILCVPLKWKEKIIGVLSITGLTHSAAFTEEEIRLANLFAEQAAVAVSNAQLFEETRRHAEQLEMLNRIGLAIASGLDMDKVLRTIHEQCNQIALVDCFYIALYDDETADLHIPLFYENGQYSTRPMINLNQESSITGHVIQTRKLLYFPDTLDPHCQLPAPLMRSGGAPSRTYAAAPLILRDHVVGVISIQSYQPAAYTPNHLRLFETIATQAAIAVENARLYVQVQRLAIVDELTGVYNYRGLMELGPREVERAQRFGRPLSALFFDIDHFRDFNNRYSHATGNQVLRAVADYTRSCVRSVDLVARYGGEEFVVLLPEAGLSMCHDVAERLRRGIEQTRLLTEWGELGVTISIGVAQLAPDIPNLAALVDRADYAEHLAKDQGRNRVVVAE